ncbi:MAG: rhamnulose-1-phosphate aldolase [Bacteroidetes bacterium]|nr:rhamnulose-1-phosphate aldolase [Bacteroidota bacterium]
MYQSLLDSNPSLSPVLAEITRVGRYLWHKGWAERNAGNISVRITGILKEATFDRIAAPELPLSNPFPELAGEIFIMTGTGKRMRDIYTDPFNNTLIIHIEKGGTAYRVISHSIDTLGDLRPTSELSSHLNIHLFLRNNRPNSKVVVHTHPGELIALTHHPDLKNEKVINQLIWSMHPEAIVVLPKGVGLVPYTLTGSHSLGVVTLKALENHDVVLWEKHGCLAVGQGVEEAFDLIDVVSKSADIYFKCRQAGFVPEGLTPEQLEQLRRAFGEEEPKTDDC